MLLQMPHDDTNKITNAYASDFQDESQKPLNDESHCEVHQTGEELHQEIPTLQLTNTDVICSTPFSDLGNYEVVCSVSPLQLMTQTRHLQTHIPAAQPLQTKVNPVTHIISISTYWI
ncbi:hypothetical protein HHUSO_G27331 [Huso huso]|uniref:Uncharacterized protein n=1 Tax=Huso huso TaxID=61971 RepID=A0ABR0YJD6_HUSHU